MHSTAPGSQRRYRSVALATAAGAVLTALGFTAGLFAAEAPARRVQTVLSRPLANAPGQMLTAVVIEYPPGFSSKPHHHAGSVFGYVLSGEIRSGVDGAEPKVFKAGEAFFEPPGTHHTVSANASTTEPASLLAVIVANEGAKLTTYDTESH
jgi:quercetin dioxygenase-like cupin family protein